MHVLRLTVVESNMGGVEGVGVGMGCMSFGWGGLWVCLDCTEGVVFVNCGLDTSDNTLILHWINDGIVLSFTHTCTHVRTHTHARAHTHTHTHTQKKKMRLFQSTSM